MLPHKSGEVVGQMPDQMFSDLQAALPIDESHAFEAMLLSWPQTEKTTPFQHQVLNSLEPCLDAIRERERLCVRFIGFTIRNGLVLPGKTPFGDDMDSWHRDGNFFNLPGRYATSNCLSMEIQGIKPAKPGQLVCFNKRKHRSPINPTTEIITRTWVRAEAYHIPWNRDIDF